MPPPLLLVHDDLATIASVRRVLTRAGHSVHLATSTADALSAFEHLSPSAILLAPAVEGGRGTQLLAELRARAAGASTPVVLLGQPVEGMDLALVPTPIEASALLEAVESALRGPDAEDLPLLDAGHMEELPPLVDAALAEAEADLEAEAFAGLPERRRPPEAAQEVAEAEALTHAAWEEADEARARAAAAESGRAEAEAARATAEEALRSYQRAGAEERARRTEAEARVLAEAEEAKRLDAEARTARAQVEEARARAEEAHVALRAAQAQGTAEAELLAAALREEAARRTSELAVQERLRAEAEARAEREAQGRAEAEARAATEMARLAAEVRAREETAARAQQAAEARAAEEVTRLAKEVQERDAAARRARAEAEDWAARERQALVQAERAQAQAQALEVEAAHLAERLAHGERAALEALGRAEEALRRERATGEALRGELAAARAHSAALPGGRAHGRAPGTAAAPGAVGGAPGRASAVPRVLGAEAGAWASLRGHAPGVGGSGRRPGESRAAGGPRPSAARGTGHGPARAPGAGDAAHSLAGPRGARRSRLHPPRRVPAFSGRGRRPLWTRPPPLRRGRCGFRTRRWRRSWWSAAPSARRRCCPCCSGARWPGPWRPSPSGTAPTGLAADASPPAGGCAPERPLLSVLAEALRRALPQEEVEARTHATRGVPRRLVRTALEPYGFAAGERRLLEAVDGERTALELLRRAGIRQDAGLRALAVAQALGLLDVLPPESPAPSEVAPEVELERLEKKWAATEEADYFSVLGLPRTAGTEEVQRAHARLAAEFDPLRYAGHPDPEVPARATRLLTLLDEAAQALGDERLRQAYVRSLVDGEGGSRAN